MIPSKFPDGVLAAGLGLLRLQQMAQSPHYKQMSLDGLQAFRHVLLQVGFNASLLSLLPSSYLLFLLPSFQFPVSLSVM